jgi:hypothetical protein
MYFLCFLHNKDRKVFFAENNIGPDILMSKFEGFFWTISMSKVVGKVDTNDMYQQ